MPGAQQSFKPLPFLGGIGRRGHGVHAGPEPPRRAALAPEFPAHRVAEPGIGLGPSFVEAQYVYHRQLAVPALAGYQAKPWFRPEGRLQRRADPDQAVDDGFRKRLPPWPPLAQGDHHLVADLEELDLALAGQPAQGQA